MKQNATTFFVFWLLLFTTAAFAQVPDTIWTKTYGGPSGDVGFAADQTSDGGYVIVGQTYFPGPNNDVYLVKTDVNGDTNWTKTYGGTQQDHGVSVQQTSDGGYIIVGSTYSFGAGSYDIYLIKTYSNGNMQWSKTYGGASGDDGYSVKQTSDGGYIITGMTYSFGTGNVYLIKTDANGDSSWTKRYGGTDIASGRSVQQTSDGGYIIAGSLWLFSTSRSDVYIIKTNSNGDSLWSKTYGGSDHDAAGSIVQTSDNGYIIAGYTRSYGAGADDVYLIKTDANGDSTWTKIYGGAGNEYSNSVVQTSDNGYVIAAQTTSFGAGGNDMYLIRIDASGNSLWNWVYGGVYDDISRAVFQISTDEYITAGYLTMTSGYPDVSLIKIGVSYNFNYLPGDANMANGLWPPSVIGGDVTYLVNYFKGSPSSQSCLLGGFWCSADANGDCIVMGSDVIRLVAYFRGAGVIQYCPTYPPAYPPIPPSAPPGWPNCE